MICASVCGDGRLETVRFDNFHISVVKVVLGDEELPLVLGKLVLDLHKRVIVLGDLPLASIDLGNSRVEKEGGRKEEKGRRCEVGQWWSSQTDLPWLTEKQDTFVQQKPFRNFTRWIPVKTGLILQHSAECSTVIGYLKVG
jgi:hypothetical protein